MSDPTPTERATRCPTCGADFLWEQMVERERAQARAEEREAITAFIREWNGTKCTGHEDNPCCHVRTAQAIADWITAQGREGA